VTTNKPPRIYCDVNGRINERAYLPTHGTFEDLRKLGLTLAQALGKEFLLVMPDGNEELIAHGTVINDPEFGFLLEADEAGFQIRPRT